MFDAFKFVVEKVKETHKSIILFDNYIDANVLTILDNRNEGVTAVISKSEHTPLERKVRKQIWYSLFSHTTLLQTIIVFLRLLLVDIDGKMLEYISYWKYRNIFVYSRYRQPQSRS